MVIFGLGERRDAGYFETLGVVDTFFKEAVRAVISKGTYTVSGKSKRVVASPGEICILFNETGSVKYTETLAVSKIALVEDFSVEIRHIRTGLIPYVKKTQRKKGHRKF
jgi:hypothetical protein